MGDEIKGEVRIVGYVDDLEYAAMAAEKQEMPVELINDMNNIHDAIVELEPLLTEQEHYDRLTTAVEVLIDDLVTSSRGNDENRSGEIVEKLKECVDELKKYLTNRSKDDLG